MGEIISMIIVVFGIALAFVYQIFSFVLGWFLDYGWKLVLGFWALFVLLALWEIEMRLKQIRDSINAKGK